MFTLLAMLAPAFATDSMQFCNTYQSTHTTTVMDSDGNITTHDLAVDGYELLLNTTIAVLGNDKGDPSCVTAQLSLHNYRGIGQEYTAVQVLIDNVPMTGHLTACQDKDKNPIACALFPHDGWIPGHSYGFAMMVPPGLHRVELKYAGVDSDPINHPSPTTGTYAGGTVLTLTHQ